MSRTFDEVFAEGKRQAEAEAEWSDAAWDEPWEDADNPVQAEDRRRQEESPEMEADALFEHIKQPKPVEHEPRVLPAKADRPSWTPPAEGSLAARLAATPAPAVGRVVAQQHTMSIAADQVAGMGVFQADGGRLEIRGVVVNVDREKNGRLVGLIRRGDARFSRVEAFTAKPGPTAEAEELRWLGALMSGAALPGKMLLVVSTVQFELEKLEALAVEADAIVVCFEASDEVGFTWEPKLLEAKAEVPPAVAAWTPDPERPLGPSVNGRELAGIARQLRGQGFPEKVFTLDGHRLSVAYPHAGAEAVFSGYADYNGHQRELEVEGHGTRTPISELTFRV